MSWPGCTSPTDASYIAALLPGTLAYDNFANIVSDCTLKMGCLAVGTQCMAAGGQDIAQGKCISDCIVQQTGWLLSDNCAWCFGEFAGVCAFKSCLSDCAVNAAGPACTSCLATNCDPQANGCKAGN